MISSRGAFSCCAEDSEVRDQASIEKLSARLLRLLVTTPLALRMRSSVHEPAACSKQESDLENQEKYRWISNSKEIKIYGFPVVEYTVATRWDSFPPQMFRNVAGGIHIGAIRSTYD